MNERDLDVLNELFKAGKPIRATDITLAQRELTQSTVTAVLRKLLNEGLVEVAGIGHSGRVLARQYVPTNKAKESIIRKFVESYKRFKDVIPLEELYQILKEEIE